MCLVKDRGLESNEQRNKVAEAKRKHGDKIDEEEEQEGKNVGERILPVIDLPIEYYGAPIFYTCKKRLKRIIREGERWKRRRLDLTTPSSSYGCLHVCCPYAARRSVRNVPLFLVDCSLFLVPRRRNSNDEHR